MEPRVLLTYASRTGSTREVAEFMALILRERGWQVDLKPIAAVKDLEAYPAVIVGSAIQEQHWLPEATAFVREHQEELGTRPLIIFALAMNLRIPDIEHYHQVYSYLSEVLSLVQPLEVGLFAGSLNYKLLSETQKQTVTEGGLPEGDYRRWQDVRAWVCEVSDRLWLELRKSSRGEKRGKRKEERGREHR